MKSIIKIYIAGKLGTNDETEFLEEIDKICKEQGFDTFLPHRDIGICKGTADIERVFRGDITEGFKDCKLVIADLNGLHVGAGTTWELGYAYAKGIPVIGIKTDEKAEDALDYLSPILIGAIRFVESLEELEKEIKDLKSSLEV